MLLFKRNKIIKVNLDELYDFSLMHTEELRPWAFETGRYICLEARCQFTKLYLEKKGKLSDEQIKATPYYCFLNNDLTQRPRDGGKDWIYGNPGQQVNRFVQLIESFLKNGYICNRRSKVLDLFCSEKEPHLEKRNNGEIIAVDYKNKPFEGLISVLRYKGYFSIWNGTHRLAILKAFREKFIFDQKEIPVMIDD
jgi:hypothetical protein